jgi:hypothetical protein
MDFDTAILLVLTGCALAWYISIFAREDRRRVKEIEVEQKAQLKRAERVRKLDGRL